MKLTRQIKNIKVKINKIDTDRLAAIGSWIFIDLFMLALALGGVR